MSKGGMNYQQIIYQHKQQLTESVKSVIPSDKQHFLLPVVGLLIGLRNEFMTGPFYKMHEISEDLYQYALLALKKLNPIDLYVMDEDIPPQFMSDIKARLDHCKPKTQLAQYKQVDGAKI
jgi:hypothetical protein